MNAFRCVIALVLLLAAPSQGAEPSTPSDAAARTLASVIESGEHPGLHYGRLGTQKENFVALYPEGNRRPLWTRKGRPTSQARALVEDIAAAEARGLDPRHYDAEALKAALEAQDKGSRGSQTALFDAALSLSALRYTGAIHDGQARPSDLGFDLEIRRKFLDRPAAVRALASADDAASALDDLEPNLSLYRRIKASLARARRLALDPDLQQLPELPVLHPGDRDPGVVALRRFFVALGWVPDEQPVDPDLYDPELVAGVERFQHNHGLEIDGVVGAGTLEELRTPWPDRLRQAELGMERARWLPRRPPGRLILVNIPEFRLRAIETENGKGRTVLGMNVIVGSAINRHETPVFEDGVEYLVFRPYWNIPYGILHREMLPRLRKDPDYLGPRNLEIVAAGGPAAETYPPTEDNLERLAEGELRLRQRPGPKNALGLVKFIFPNSHSVYLHSTPAQQLFDRTRRDFSHGCIRVEDPVALASWLLDDPQWTPETVTTAMEEGENRRVDLREEVPVYLFYTTFLVDEDDNILLLEDIYGHDARLDSWLRERYPYPAGQG